MVTGSLLGADGAFVVTPADSFKFSSGTSHGYLPGTLVLQFAAPVTAASPRVEVATCLCQFVFQGLSHPLAIQARLPVLVAGLRAPRATGSLSPGVTSPDSLELLDPVIQLLQVVCTLALGSRVAVT